MRFVRSERFDTALVILIAVCLPLRPGGALTAETNAGPGKDAASQAAATAAAPSDDVAARADVAGSLAILLQDRAVRDALQLPASHATRLDQALADVAYPLWAVRDAADAETQIKRARAFDHVEKVLDGFPAAARRRFDGIVLQVYGWPYALTPRIADALQLSTEQRSQIRRLLKDDDQSKAAAAGPLTAARQREIKQVLSAAQQRRLNELIGPPFRTDRLRLRACRAPPIEGVDAWLNGEPLDWAKLKGKVVVVTFWTFGCINCIRNLPHYKAWDERFDDGDVVLIGFHTPETKGERVLESVRAKVKEFEIKYPVAVDNGGANWNAWSNRWWPSTYLVDRDGYVRHWWYGELNWEGAKGEESMRRKIEQLLAEKND